MLGRGEAWGNGKAWLGRPIPQITAQALGEFSVAVALPLYDRRVGTADVTCGWRRQRIEMTFLVGAVAVSFGVWFSVCPQGEHELELPRSLMLSLESRPAPPHRILTLCRQAFTHAHCKIIQHTKELEAAAVLLRSNAAKHVQLKQSFLWRVDVALR